MRRILSSLWALTPVVAIGCTSSIEGGTFDDSSGGSTGSGGSVPSAGSAQTAGSSGANGTGGNANPSGGAAGAGTAGVGGGGVAPSDVVMSALGANATIGLEWSRVAGATGYRIYWSNAPGVTPATGQAIDAAEPGIVHRALTNGTPYYYVVTALTAAGEGPPSNEVSATPAGEWVLEQFGAGDFDDITTGARIPRLPVEDRIHVLLLPEGYLAGELGIFHDHATHDLEDPTSDVDRWIEEVFALDPYFAFREAFVIWYLPRASSTHTSDGGSAFGDGAETAAGPLWEALDGAGPDAFPFPPVDGSRNYVASFLMFDPNRGRAGVSGHSTSCRSPTNQDLTMRCSFGIGHAHEFTHAFSEVRDEYLEDDNNLPSLQAWSNVAPTNQCSEVPWSHLLAGNGINTTEELVGAFGRPERGYHSELLCQMNGTHDNGVYWCSGEDLTLRPNRLCNFCRELTAYRIFYRTGLLPGMNSEAFVDWASDYRQPFFSRFGFVVPEQVPQAVECDAGDKTVYEACVP